MPVLGPGPQTQINPGAHKNRIGTSTPPPLQKTPNPPPPPNEEFCGPGVFPAERTQKSQARMKLAQPYPAQNAGRKVTEAPKLRNF